MLKKVYEIDGTMIPQKKDKWLGVQSAMVKNEILSPAMYQEIPLLHTADNRFRRNNQCFEWKSKIFFCIGPHWLLGHIEPKGVKSSEFFWIHSLPPCAAVYWIKLFHGKTEI